MGVDIGKTSTRDVVTIAVDLQKNIEMIMEQENVALTLAP
jgi:hypothetical protein